VVFANAAMALYCTGVYESYHYAFEAAVESLESGRALATLEKLLAMQ
jgi:anthranilate phosphoribosyltransferase